MKTIPGQDVRGSLMVKRLEYRTAKNGKSFLSGELFDKDGTYNALIWNYDVQYKEPQPGDVLEGVFKVREYQGKIQLDIETLYAHTKARSVSDASSFVRQSGVTKQSWLTYYNAEVRPLHTHKGIEKLIDDVVNGSPFFTAPAAKTMHQNWRGGLAEHTHRILRLYVGLRASGHPTVAACDPSLVIAGAVLHDFGKAAEYEEVAPGQYEIGKWGSLMGHLAGGAVTLAVKIAEGGYEFDDDTFQHLMHVLLAHHGQVDWGSPVVPATREALLVHTLDNLDGKFSMMEEATEGQSVRGLNTKVWRYQPIDD